MLHAFGPCCRNQKDRNILSLVKQILAMMHTGEGFVQKSDTSFTYNTFLKDHLGNTRVVFGEGTWGQLVVTLFGLLIIMLMLTRSKRSNYLHGTWVGSYNVFGLRGLIFTWCST
jgi:hypothetical protein